MGYMIGVVFLFVILFSWFPQDVSACSCFPTHPQRRFCESSFALVGVILKRTTVDLRRVTYTVRVVRRMKGNVGAVGSEFNFETASTSAACGVSYTIGAMEFLMGSENRIGLCNLLFPTTFENWFYLLTSGRNSYIRNCRCKVLEEFETSMPMSCKLSNNSKEKECYRKTAICRRAQGGTCEWKNDDQCP